MASPGDVSSSRDDHGTGGSGQATCGKSRSRAGSTTSRSASNPDDGGPRRHARRRGPPSRRNGPAGDPIAKPHRPSPHRRAPPSGASVDPAAVPADSQFRRLPCTSSSARFPRLPGSASRRRRLTDVPSSFPRWRRARDHDPMGDDPDGRECRGDPGRERLRRASCPCRAAPSASRLRWQPVSPVCGRPLSSIAPCGSRCVAFRLLLGGGDHGTSRGRGCGRRRRRSLATTARSACRLLLWGRHRGRSPGRSDRGLVPARATPHRARASHDRCGLPTEGHRRPGA